MNQTHCEKYGHYCPNCDNSVPNAETIKDRTLDDAIASIDLVVANFYPAMVHQTIEAVKTVLLGMKG